MNPIVGIDWLAALLICASTAGAVYQLVAARAVQRFAARTAIDSQAPAPPATILKPVYGNDADLYENLKSFCCQDYPEFQVIFGAGDASDPAVAVVRRLIEELPEADLRLVIDGRLHGTNRKISNLMNMLAFARHDHLVIADSDMRVGPNYLAAVVPPLLDPAIGVVTCLYAGRPTRGLWSRLGALFINHGFLPGVLVGQLIGARPGCFGATIALSRSTLEHSGGFDGLSDTLADDYALGMAVRRLDLAVVLSPYVVDAIVHEPGYDQLIQHELRWGRTIRTIAPVGFAASAVTHAVPLALAAVVLSGGSLPTLGALSIAAAARLWLGRTTDRALGLAPSPWWLIAIRDGLSLVVLVASFCGKKITWRGHALRVAAGGRLIADGEPTT
jgi:ceramide glucosyltransferase